MNLGFPKSFKRISLIILEVLRKPLKEFDFHTHFQNPRYRNGILAMN